MQCPKCGGPRTEVLETRPVGHQTTRRRRRCPACDERFTTIEQALRTEDGLWLPPDEQRQLAALLDRLLTLLRYR